MSTPDPILQVSRSLLNERGRGAQDAAYDAHMMSEATRLIEHQPGKLLRRPHQTVLDRSTADKIVWLWSNDPSLTSEQIRAALELEQSEADRV